MHQTRQASSGVKPIASLRRGLDVLRAIDGACAASFSELRARTELPNATLARVLKTLLEAGWIRHHAESGRYTLAPEATATPPSAAWHARLSELASAPRATLQRVVPWPTDLGVRDGAAMLSVDGPYAHNGIWANFRVLGSRPSMLRSSLGRCYLSFCPDAEREEIISILSHSRDEADRAGLHPDELTRMIARVRQQGYATRNASHTSQDSPERFGALAVPILHHGHAIACICVVWILPIACEQQIVATCLAPLQRAARAIGETVRQTDLDSLFDTMRTQARRTAR
ncbi:IclR family transcriptional regulator domain-containing protein [Burkholderia ubonensis]|uniref:IclR family transcriptional regulator domain-containing protein n=1 Tax=Burkholderia ubonensis TaxID=101571 RepID=UPI0007C8216D|nr:IclR family transcriptional regulator C-terminal domain-containing protein [Burkholderia ubonensis]